MIINLIGSRTGTIFIFAALFVLPVTSFAQEDKRGLLREVFGVVPSEFFNMSCCEGDSKKFLSKYATTEDAKNGYLAGADTEEDPQNGSFTMKLFGRGDGSYIVGFHSVALRWSDFYFLEYRNGSIRNISLTIPRYSTANFYEFPRNGTDIRVYKKKFDEPGEPVGVDNSVTKGRKLYDLVWTKGKFTVRK